MRIAPLTLCVVTALGLSAGAASAYDSLGGFDQPYTGASNMFGKGAWGNGRGTAIPLPDQGPSYGFYYGQPYASGGSNLFGTGFWASEYTVRTGGSQGRTTARAGDAIYADGPLGDQVAGVGYGPKGGYDGRGESGYGKDGGKQDHGKPGKDGQECKPGEGKPRHDTPKSEIEYRYIPYPRTQTIVLPRRSATVVVMERTQTSDLGHLNVTAQSHRESFGAICLDGKGNEHAALLVKPDGADDAYAGEIFRCEGDQMLRVSYATGAVTIRGSVQTADGTSYKDCDGGDALVRSRGGELACATKRPMGRGMERALASNDGDTAEIGFASAPAGGGIDISGLELTGGVGGVGGM